ncbi:hypothetical protein NP233_g2176 [Leucocoprinus birnbaumii]|uniref:Uncharacterized protein n=1 Tax=Leucocoprinus birnbaumii TaxID=56174 RepID=A0AAD5VZB6_9AGAR|nr:hypothetical protein NP233_g2176 [Leucocoprinus birnbaumii]
MSYDSRPYYAETYTIFIEPIRDPSPYARTFNIDKQNRPLGISSCSAFAYGLGAGLVGITAMSISQTIEQHITGRLAIHVPGESVLRFFRCAFGAGCKEFFHRQRRGHNRRSKSPKSQGKEAKKSNEAPSPEEEESGNCEPYNLTEPPSKGGELAEPSSSTRAAAKWAAYFGQGAILGGVRGIMSYYGARGLLSDVVFLTFTSSFDRYTLWEEVTSNTPFSQLLLSTLPELSHQVVYAFVTGFFCDHWVN